MEPYRILSLDGGGTWALIQVMALQKIYSEHALGHEVLKDFDLVAANSGGSITLGGLVANLPLSETLGYFRDKEKRGRIFNPLPFDFDPDEKRPLRYLWNRFVRRILPVGAKYVTADKLKGLEHVLTDSPRVFKTREGKKVTSPEYALSDLPGKVAESAESQGRSPHFLVCGFSYDKRRAKFFRSNPASLASGSPGPEMASLAHAIHASTNAPVNFFIAPADVLGKPYWDGAIAGLNNPVLAAVTEALANGIEAHRIQVLSIGTGTIALPAKNDENPADDDDLLLAPPVSTLFGDLSQLATAVLDDPPDNATFISHVVLSPKGLVDVKRDAAENPVVRMTPVMRPARASPAHKWTLPEGFTKKEFLGLVNLDLDATTEDEIALLAKFGTAWIEGRIPNQAIREGDAERQIGHTRFGDALGHWRTLTADRPRVPSEAMA